MKPEDIFDAITDIRDDQIEFAKPRRSRLWYIAPIAACLVLAIIAAPFLRARLPGAQPLYTGAAQLAEARYPEPDVSGALEEGSFSGKAEGPEPIEQGRNEYFENREEYSRRLGGFWADSAETFLTAGNGENMIFSPISLYTVLGMSAELCEGGPRQEILSLLKSPGIEDLRDSARQIWCASFSREQSTCLLANSLWLSNSVDYKQPVLDILAENYFADSFRGDMGSDEYDRIHLDWLSEKTNGYLDGLLPELDTDPMALMYLDSTLYYKARWFYEFDPAQNTEGSFRSAYMEQPCTFMNQSDENTYFKGENFIAVSKHMYGSQEMLFVLPNEGITTNELLADPEYKEFTAVYLEDPYKWKSRSRAIINLSVPKFDLTSNMEMAPGLRDMGVNGIFESGKGSFSPMTDQDFAFTSVTHTCRVSIDEEGCEGASVMIMEAAGAEPPPEEEIDLILDRPFLFAMISNGSLPVYMGAVNRIDS